MKAWTYSSLEKYQTCPRQYYHVRVLRDVKEPPTEHTIWGEKVHTALENYIKFDEYLPDDMSHWDSFMTKIKKLQGDKTPEAELAVDCNFQACSWEDSWSRGIVDLLVVSGKTGIVIDYKTGKRKPSDQLSLYAAFVFAHYPEIESVHTAFVWLKDKKIDKETFTRGDVSAIWQRFLPVVARVEQSIDSDKWPAKPSGLCHRWCHVLTCEHNGRNH